MPLIDEYRTCGKQVLLNDKHYADAIDEDAAKAIAHAMRCVYLAKLGKVERGNHADAR